MKNVKLGFQFGLGLGLARFIWAIPAGINDPRVKREWKRLKKLLNSLRNAEILTEPKTQTEETIRKTSAFPQCKNKIGFVNEE